ncbi:hypothetical protein MLD38_026408 [Melastoma candidum]|uniref:Uncharacterized protein n=1 Tax=Melastoma candidum TaxID=119954 RepID=A0ACB9NZW4_9MYRT|nr:hypothetical protein MLD38_026408 [Melastoma candidum]
MTYAKCGCIEEAARVFQEMSCKNMVSWNSMIKAYAVHGNPREALARFDQLHNSGPNPDDIKFLSILYYQPVATLGCTGARVAGEISLGLDPDDSGVYALLEEVYAKRKELGQVRRARRMTRKRKVMKKAPGHDRVGLGSSTCSWG